MSGAAPTREIAYRVFADEFADSTYSYAESDDDRAPQYLVTPTGARINRLFVVGVLTEIEEVSDGVLRARIVDPTGAFVLYAGQYQPDALAFFERADPPMFVALTGKPRTFEPEGSDRIFTSLRPERVTEVDAGTRDRWVVQTAEHTLERAAIMGMALEYDGDDLAGQLEAVGIDPGLAAGIPHAIREYEPSMGYLEAVQEMALDTVRVVAGETDETQGVDVAPSEDGNGTVRTEFASVSLDPSEPESEGEPASTGLDEQGAKTEATEDDSTAADESGPEVPNEAEAAESAPPSADTEPETESDETDPEPSEIDADSDEAIEEPVETDELYELSEEEREEVKRNFDVGFESGAEIDSPESETEAEPAPVEEPEPETVDDSTDLEGDEGPTDSAADHLEESENIEDGSDGSDDLADEPEESENIDKGSEESEDTAEESDESATDADEAEENLQDLVIDTLQELGDGDGVPRGTLIETIQDRHEYDEDSIEDAIQDALLGGRCFESGADDLKPI